MKAFPSPAAQFRSSWPVLGLVLLVSAVLIGVVLFLHSWKGIPTRTLTGDINSTLRAPIYTGFLAQVGIFLWSAAATLCLFSAQVLARHPELKRFLVASGLLTLLLALDDVFLLHEILYPSYLGIPEKLVYVLYAVLVLIYLVRFHSIILRTEYILLGMALCLFGVSVILDSLFPNFTYKDIYEDGPKLAGILTWLAYFFRVGVFAAQQSAPLDDPSAAPPAAGEIRRSVLRRRFGLIVSKAVRS